MVKIIWDTWTFKELKRKLKISSLKDYLVLIDKLKLKKEELIEQWKEECKLELINLKRKLEVSKKEVDNYLYNHQHDKEHFFSKIKFIIIVYNKTRHIRSLSKKIQNLENNFENCSIHKVSKYINSIVSKQHFVESLKKVYYWAIWEEKVVNEFKYMYSDWILINDFNQHFNEPIFTKWWKDIIMSIQIDHIFINSKGIFLIETKNRSNNSKEEFKFSPIQQIERSWHAFYFYLKDLFKYDNFLSKQEFPNIYKIVVFIWWNKMKSDNPYIKVLYLNELKNYINYRISKIKSEEYNYIWDLLIEENIYSN